MNILSAHLPSDLDHIKYPLFDLSTEKQSPYNNNYIN